MLTVYYYQSLHAPKLSCVFVDVNASVLRFWRVGACPCVEACRRKCWRVWRRFRQLVSGWTRFEACTRRRLTARLGAVSVFTLIVIAFYCQLSCVDMNNVIQYCPRNRFVSSVSAATVNTAVCSGASTHPDAQNYSYFSGLSWLKSYGSHLMKMLRVSLWCLLVPCLSVVAQTDMMSYVKVVRRGKHLVHAVQCSC